MSTTTVKLWTTRTAFRYAPLWPVLYWALTILGIVYCAAAVAGLTTYDRPCEFFVACDAASYYYADPYDPVPITPQYGYSPAYTLAFSPFTLVPFEVYQWAWFGLHVAAWLWLRAGWMLAVPLLNDDLILGNVNVFVALALVLSLSSKAWAWAFPLLTKVLPGVGMVWHLVRREWTALAWATGATAAIVLVGLVLNPVPWFEWVALLREHGSGNAGLLALRLVLAAGVIAYAGLTSRAWLVPVGMVVGWSAIGPPVFAMLAAVPRLRAPDDRREVKWVRSGGVDRIVGQAAAASPQPKRDLPA